MLAERREALLSNEEKWKNKSDKRRISDLSVSKTSSLEERKAALLQASGGWKQRVQNDDTVNALNANYRLQRSKLATSETSSSLTQCASKSDPRQTSSTENNSVRNLAKTALLIRPAAELPERKLQDNRIGKGDTKLQRSTPVIKSVCRPARPNRRPPSTVEALTVDVGNTYELGVKRSPTSDKENEECKQPPAKQPFSPQTNQDRTPKLGVKNCGIALKKPDLKRPYPDHMLVRCKGQDVRLVAPRAASVHDCATFVLITATKLLIFEGEFSTLIEKSKAKQIAHSVVASRDLACSASKFELVKEDHRAEAIFWEILGDKRHSRQIPLELEQFLDPENLITFEDIVKVANAVYEIDSNGDAVKILQNEYPHSSILDSTKILVFDFGSEIYSWFGHESDRGCSKAVMDFAEKLRRNSIPSSEIVASESETATRPDWILIRKLTEGLPDCLFRLKFIDPLPEPCVKTPKTPKFTTPRFVYAEKKSGKIAAVPLCGVEDLLKDDDEMALNLAERLAGEEGEINVLELEETMLKPEDDNVITEGKLYYQLYGETLEELEVLEEFFDDQCYVIRWDYRVERSGIRKLDGTPGIQKDTGRQRHCYFYWFGKHASKKARGSLALALRRLDKDRSEHVLLEQGCQGPLFLHLFDGKLLISHSDNSKTANHRVYIVHGSSNTAFYAEEIEDLKEYQFRPQTSYVIVEPRTKTTSIWHGKLSTKDIMKAATQITDHINKLRGYESVKTTISYPVCNTFEWRQAPRIFRLFDTTGEQLHSLQFSRNVNFTFRQNDLKDTCLVDQGSCLWIWTELLVTTFHLQVAARYWKIKNRTEKKATVICKSKEPEEFKALFPSWTPFDFSILVQTDEFDPEEPQDLSKLLDERTKFRSLHEVLNRQLPRGCDTKKLEKFLNDEDFNMVFKMERNVFYGLPKWKQSQLKKDAKLF